MSRRTRNLMTAMLTAGALLALPGSAVAEPGQITYDGCLANNDAVPGCFDVPGTPLREAKGVATSPDGKSVYVVSSTSRSITHLRRAMPDGQIEFDRCWANDAPTGCTELPGSPLSGARGVAVSPDGKSVYVASDSSSIAHFSRDTATGRLTLEECLADDSTDGCTAVPGSPLSLARGVAVSPDGKSVYVGSEGSHSISHFVRDTATGRITWDGCHANDASEGCDELPGSPLREAAGVAVSPDGKSVYVAAESSASVTHFLRDGADGKIEYDVCLANGAADGCIELPGSPLSGALGVAVSPDGRSVYVASALSHSIAHLIRDTTTGELEYLYCVANDASQGCVDLPGEPLSGANAVAVSPDGKSVYVVSSGSDSITHLFRSDPDGVLIWDRCLSSLTTSDCDDLPTPLGSPQGVAVSPNGRSVYATAFRTYSVTHFFREVAPPPDDRGTAPGDPGTTPSDPGTGPPTDQPSPDGPPGFGPSTLVTLEPAGKRIRARGPIKVRVSNQNGFEVQTRLSGESVARVAGAGGKKRRITLKPSAFSVGANATKTVKLALPKKLRALLKRRGRLSLRLTALVNDPAGGTRMVRKQVGLRLKR